MSRQTQVRRRSDDRGTSLVEMVVAMGIFSMVLSVIVGATMVMVQDVNKSQNVYDASADARVAFSRLDKQVRYATAINRPGLSGGDWYVEFQSIDGGNIPTCHQWRLVTATSQLQQRDWTGVPTSAPVWSTVATSVVNSPTQPPFTFAPAGPTVPVQILTVTLVMSRGNLSVGTSTLTTSFAGRNTDVSTTTNPDVNPADGQSDAPVCQQGVSRP